MKDRRIGKIGKQNHLLVIEWIVAGCTALDIADVLGVNPETIRKFARKRGLQIQRVDMSGENHPCWAGGMVSDRSGYLLRRVAVDGPYGYLIRALQKRGVAGSDPNGYAPEHRIVMHDQLGRPLLPGEVVDHIDGDKRNNDPSNLRVFPSNAEHLRETLKGRVPNWTQEGRAKMTGRPVDPNSANQRRLAKLSQSKNDDPASPSPNDLNSDQS
jgi:hypothetical protein